MITHIITIEWETGQRESIPGVPARDARAMHRAYLAGADRALIATETGPRALDLQRLRSILIGPGSATLVGGLAITGHTGSS